MTLIVRGDRGGHPSADLGKTKGGRRVERLNAACLRAPVSSAARSACRGDRPHVVALSCGSNTIVVPHPANRGRKGQNPLVEDVTPLWLFADQLGPHFRSGALTKRPIVLIESAHAFAHKRYHRQKLHLVLAGMRQLAADLGDRVTLIRSETYRKGLLSFGRPVVVHEPGSHAADRLVRRLHADGLVAEILPTAGFALSKAEFAHWAHGRRRFVMEDFYRDQRRRFEILMEPDGEPVGGRWNFDHDNRKPPPKQRTLQVPKPWQPRENDIDVDVQADLDARVRDGTVTTLGVDGPRQFAVSRTQALRALTTFLDHRLPTFGPHQDAILGEDWAMSHALLSVPLNMGLLSPLEVVEQAERRYRDGAAPLASVEGFIRQVLGWREWVWHLYWHLGPDYLDRNHLLAMSPSPRGGSMPSRTL
ncbi:cryptochrome/photolyase family protein [Amycolatopsis sp. H20-H5]|uniref:cryptochrome/photolyase family protein n=1 Tax=Amycolatopsis sp. H20-H5 TaxID=3046309 RepID=UPI002DBBFF92|nr:cryptochrome/photolyase family protein [Amycolatopsis sp. H20-H5]MEC3974993.1 cryptochrome/photolyase family protein [Amycolatopsis sp. H20-H5]